MQGKAKDVNLEITKKVLQLMKEHGSQWTKPWANKLFTSVDGYKYTCLLYTSPSPRDATLSRMPSSA